MLQDRLTIVSIAKRPSYCQAETMDKICTISFRGDLIYSSFPIALP